MRRKGCRSVTQKETYEVSSLDVEFFFFFLSLSLSRGPPRFFFFFQCALTPLSFDTRIRFDSSIQHRLTAQRAALEAEKSTPW